MDWIVAGPVILYCQVDGHIDVNTSEIDHIKVDHIYVYHFEVGHI